MDETPNIPVIPTGLTDEEMALFTRLAEAMFKVIEETHATETEPIPLPPLATQPSLN